MAAPSAFQGLSLLIADALGHDSSPRASSARSDVTTPRTWSAPPSRAVSIEPLAAIERDVVDVRCARARAHAGRRRGPPPPSARAPPRGARARSPRPVPARPRDRAPAAAAPPPRPGPATSAFCPQLPDAVSAPRARSRPRLRRGSRDQTRRKPRFSSNQIPDVMPVDRWD
jgi:hypothetical protein